MNRAQLKTGEVNQQRKPAASPRALESQNAELVDTNGRISSHQHQAGMGGLGFQSRAHGNGRPHFGRGEGEGILMRKQGRFMP